MWGQLGKLEALKGTILHKQIELYMQELGRWQLASGLRGISLSDVPEEVLFRTREAPNVSAAMLRVVSQMSSVLWDQWCAPVYFRSCVQEMHSSEFQKFESWLASKPSFSPFRSEWSLYHDGFHVLKWWLWVLKSQISVREKCWTTYVGGKSVFVIGVEKAYLSSGYASDPQ